MCVAVGAVFCEPFSADISLHQGNLQGILQISVDLGYVMPSTELFLRLFS